MIRLPFGSSSAKTNPTTQQVAQAWSDGYTCAMTEGVKVIEATLLTKATEQALARLESVIVERAMALRAANPRQALELQQKLDEFRERLSTAKSKDEKEKYTHYCDAMTWALNVQLYPHETDSK